MAGQEQNQERPKKEAEGRSYEDVGIAGSGKTYQEAGWAGSGKSYDDLIKKEG